MRYADLTAAATVCLLVMMPASSHASGTPGQDGRTGAQKPAINTPRSLRTEHEEIHKALLEATRAPGRVGAAAKELAAVLDPHVERENEIALPPLGLLAPLAAGEPPAGLQEALAMTDALRKESPRMLEAQPANGSADDSDIDRILADSFPASDAPPWTLGVTPVLPHNESTRRKDRENR